MSRAKRPRMKKAALAGELVQALLEQKGLTEKLGEYRAWAVWDEVVGPQIASKARPVRIRDKVLEIRVAQAVWMQQLQLMKPMILTRLNDRLGKDTLKDIFLRRGRVEAAPAPAQPPEALTPWKSQNLDEEELAAIEADLAVLEDDEVRNALSSLRQHQAQLEKARKQESEN